MILPQYACVLHITLYFIAILCLSQAANLVRLAHAPPDVIGSWRLLAAALIMLPFAFKKGELRKVLTQKDKNLVWIFVSAIFFFLHLWTYFFSAQNTKIANCMIIFATNPLFTALGALFLFKEKFTLRLAIAYLLATIGIYQLVIHSLSFDQGLAKGDLSALASAVFFAGYLLSGKKARQRTANTSYAFLMYTLTGCFFLVNGFAQKLNFFDYGMQTWLAIAGTVIFPTLLGHALFTYLMQTMNINLMTCGKLIEPVASAFIAYLLFNESLNINTMYAFGFTSSAVLVLFFPWHKLKKTKGTVPPEAI